MLRSRGGPADDLDIRPQAATINGQVNVQIVVMGGDENRWRLLNSGSNEGVEIRGVPDDILAVSFYDVGIAFYDPEEDAPFPESLRRGLPHPAATENNDGGG